MASSNRKTRNPGWRPGIHWVECMRTGMIIRSEDAVEEWNGLIVAASEWEPRHPQDLIRGIPDDIAAKGLLSPENQGTNISGGGALAVAGWAVAGEAVAGTNFTSIAPTGSFTYPAGHDPLH